MQLFRNGKLLCYILLVITGCEKDNVDVEGCTDPNALNYNLTATVLDESCEYETGENTQPMPSIIISSKQKECKKTSRTTNIYEIKFFW